MLFAEGSSTRCEDTITERSKLLDKLTVCLSQLCICSHSSGGGSKYISAITGIMLAYAPTCELCTPLWLRVCSIDIFVKGREGSDATTEAQASLESLMPQKKFVWRVLFVMPRDRRAIGVNGWPYSGATSGRQAVSISPNRHGVSPYQMVWSSTCGSDNGSGAALGLSDPPASWSEGQG